ncbi:MAG: hypothetical protein HPY85_07595 [Anaerolineae bacterium]|nr:hypothetical protein [Anaerolineae bacterium]
MDEAYRVDESLGGCLLLPFQLAWTVLVITVQLAWLLLSLVFASGLGLLALVVILFALAG